MSKQERIAIARLTLVVEWDKETGAPDRQDLEEILDKAKETGDVRQATFETLALRKEELV